MQLVYINETFLKLNNKESVKTSKIALKALFYDETTKAWTNPFEMDQRSKLDYILNFNEFNERKWILLKKNTSKTTDEKYEHDGPYSSYEIFNMITSSALKLNNPIWKEGMAEWLRLKDTATFKAFENFSKPIEADVSDILSSVMEYDPQMHRVEEKKPSPGEPGEVFIILDDK